MERARIVHDHRRSSVATGRSRQSQRHLFGAGTGAIGKPFHEGCGRNASAEQFFVDFPKAGLQSRTDGGGKGPQSLQTPT